MKPVLAVDFGGTVIKAGLVADGAVVAKRTCAAEAERGLRARLPVARDLLRELCRERCVAVDDCAGVGLIFPCIVDARRGRVISAAKNKFEDAPDVDLPAWAHRELGVPLRAENDAHAALLGEWQYGAGAGCANLVMLTLGTGIGCSVIVEGRPLRGRHFQTGLLGGHVVVQPGGRPCCHEGGRGCVEAETGSWALPAIAREQPGFAESALARAPQLDGRLLEVSFDCLMFHDHRAMLGDCAERFGQEFPIRYDWLDTFGGGNLSLQCHPRPDYIRRHFGERFTQDETYYILDCTLGAEVHLGFRDGANPDEFRAAVERSEHEATALDVRRFVHTATAHPHDLFLIPHGTIHCSGVNNLVLEISATPYIFTFKMHDWQRLDLDGRPRPLNIARAFDNLHFDRRLDELISRPRVLEQRDGGRVVHLPTHREHFYDVHRLEFDREMAVTTDGGVHVLSVVEGRAVVVECGHGERRRFHYAETFVIPAAARAYRLLSEDGAPVKVVKTFVKPGHADISHAP